MPNTRIHTHNFVNIPSYVHTEYDLRFISQNIGKVDKFSLISFNIIINYAMLRTIDENNFRVLQTKE